MSDDLGAIYFIRGGDAVKIGWTQNLDRRMRQLQTAHPAPLELLGWVPGRKDDEKRLHERFGSLRLHGEWFQASADLLRAIPWLCDEWEQREARCEELLRWQAVIIGEAWHAVHMTAPPHESSFREDFDDLLWRLGRAQTRAMEAMAEADRWAEARVVRLGPFARYGIYEAKRPTTEEVWARIKELEAWRADRDTAPADYLDLRAIFDDEFAEVA